MTLQWIAHDDIAGHLAASWTFALQTPCHHHRYAVLMVAPS